MKKIIASTLLCGALVTSAMAEEQTRIGVGVGITTPGASQSSLSSSVRMPIDTAKDFRIEPELALGYVSKDGSDHNDLYLGSGFYIMNQPSGKINLYYGGKAGIQYIKDKPKGGQSDSNTYFQLGGVFGFEYMFDRHFSAGGEASANLGFGDATVFYTQGLALLRYYF